MRDQHLPIDVAQYDLHARSIVKDENDVVGVYDDLPARQGIEHHKRHGILRVDTRWYRQAVSERELSLAVVGIDHPNTDKGKTNRRYELLLCAPGDPIELRWEPKNPHDENAVGVFSERGVQVGYLKSERAAWFVRQLASGETCTAIFQEMASTIGVIRVRLGEGAPTLPPPRPAARPADDSAQLSDWSDDFTPDPEPGEWGA